jgi:hypothetical protein
MPSWRCLSNTSSKREELSALSSADNSKFIPLRSLTARFIAGFLFCGNYCEMLSRQQALRGMRPTDLKDGSVSADMNCRLIRFMKVDTVTVHAIFMSRLLRTSRVGFLK